MPLKLSSELVLGVAVLLVGGTICLKAEEPITVVAAARDIDSGLIEPTDVTTVTIKRSEIRDWLKAPDSPEASTPLVNVLVSDPLHIKGTISSAIPKGTFIYRTNPAKAPSGEAKSTGADYSGAVFNPNYVLVDSCMWLHGFANPSLRGTTYY